MYYNQVWHGENHTVYRIIYAKKRCIYKLCMGQCACLNQNIIQLLHDGEGDIKDLFLQEKSCISRATPKENLIFL